MHEDKEFHILPCSASHTKRQYLFSRESYVLQVQIFWWKASGKSVLIQYEVSMNSVCLKYVTEVQVLKQYMYCFSQ